MILLVNFMAWLNVQNLKVSACSLKDPTREKHRPESINKCVGAEVGQCHHKNLPIILSVSFIILIMHILILARVC